jgi:NAD(P)-dependent dehydrogenase (short-subunit alcohol dehydrogenase family)
MDPIARKEKRALITGGTSGIDLETARHFRDERRPHHHGVH